MAAQYGYIGNNPSNSPVIVARQMFEPTGIQTTFTFAAGYTIGYVDAYLNGSRLIEGQDYSATNGSTVSLISAAGSGDILELVAYKAFNVALPSATGNLTVSGNLTVTGNITGTASTASFATTSFGLSGTPNITVGSVTSGNINSSGVITATTFSGALTGNATGLSGTPNISVGSITLGGTTVSTLGVGIQTSGGYVGSGATTIDFRGSGISTVTVSSGIATVNITGGSAGGFSGVGYIMF